MAALVAIVGRPNVGKSALFNCIAGKRIAIVHDEPGVTRDRISAEVEWSGRAFSLVDTGGIGLLRGEKANDVIVQAARQQVELAIESAQVIVFVVNVQEGVVPLDQEVAARLRASGKPVIVAANKADHDRAAGLAAEFAELGFEMVAPVSAAHRLGIDTLMEGVLRLLPSEPESSPTNAAAPEVPKAGETDETSELNRPLRLAVIGRPNVGKSSLINGLTQSERVIVSPVPGTTRDSVDVPFEAEADGVKQRFVLIDTAGLRKARRVDSSVEFFSVKRAEDAIERCDIAILVLDAEAGITAHDKKVAGKIVEHRKACVVVINKWDLVEESVRQARREAAGKQRATRKRDSGERPASSLAEFGQWAQKYLFFLDYAPVVFASAKTGFHLTRLLETVRFVASQLKQTIPTAILNRTLHDAIEERQPVSASGQRLKFFYATQVRKAPATFLLFVNRAELFTDQYSKYLSNTLRRAFGFEGCPVLLVPKTRPRNAPVR
ncbi:MAG: ribosome biogenesis GTPase Der [Verrucomicrobia bacterium]|nr:ribosome biogenesis GTPase Der [Verrucomicrobiota bacterium]